MTAQKLTKVSLLQSIRDRLYGILLDTEDHFEQELIIQEMKILNARIKIVKEALA